MRRALSRRRSGVTASPWLHAFLIVLSFGISSGCPALATPFKITFTASVASIQGNVAALSLPFPLAVGDPMSGQYTFQSPQDLVGIFTHPNPGTQGNLKLEIADTEIQSLVNFGVVDDGPGDININNGEPADFSPPPGVPTSTLNLGYTSSTNVYPGWGGSIPGPNPTLYWNPGLALTGPEITVTQPEDLLNLDIWNDLNLYPRIHLQFGQLFGSEFDTIRVTAAMDSFAVTPEPSAIVLVAVGAITVNICRFRKLGRVFASAALLSFAFAVTERAEAGTFRVELTDITNDAHPDANYLQANFDFGTTFSSIQSVSLELTMPGGFGFSGGTVENLHYSVLDVLIHQEGFSLKALLTDGEPIIGGPRLALADTLFAEQDFEQLQPNVPKPIQFGPYIKGCWPGCILQPDQVVEYYWPAFFLTGKGEVTLQGFDTSGDPLNGIPPTTIYSKPPSVTQATLIIEATPTPETSSIGLLLIGVGLLAGRGAARIALGRDGACAFRQFRDRRSRLYG